METRHKKGKVVFVGSGPGDPELLTIKGLKAIEQADIILHDRLVSQEILDFAKPTTSLILTGKQKGAKCTTQSSINEMLVELGLEGKNIVRLKGGDVSFFSNILDELLALTQNNIEYEIVPGVTAASGCGAYAGIPLTARNHSTAVRFLTFHQSKIDEMFDWKTLASSEDTLVLYMTISNVLPLVTKLSENGADKELSIAVIEQGTTPYQKVYTSTLERSIADFKDIAFKSPSTIIIGKVVSLHKQFSWFNPKEEGIYFKELSKAE